MSRRLLSSRWLGKLTVLSGPMEMLSALSVSPVPWDLLRSGRMTSQVVLGSSREEVSWS